MKSLHIPLKLALPALVALALSACVVAPVGPAYPAAYPSDTPVAVADAPPPAPYAEVIPVAPFVGAVWIGGFWGWGGGRYAWTPGHWVAPRPGYVWAPHRWAPYGNRWHLYGGGWVRGR